MSLVQIGSIIVNLESVEIIPSKHGSSNYELVVNGNNKWSYESESKEGKALAKWLASQVKVIAPHELIEEARPKAEDHMQALQKRADAQNGGLGS